VPVEPSRTFGVALSNSRVHVVTYGLVPDVRRSAYATDFSCPPLFLEANIV